MAYIVGQEGEERRRREPAKDEGPNAQMGPGSWSHPLLMLACPLVGKCNAMEVNNR